MQVIQKPNEKAPQKQQLSSWQLVIQGILRPPRANYRESQLGPKVFVHNQFTYFRSQYMVLHQEKLKICLTIIQPDYKSQFNPIILYLHGNSSSKLQSLNLIKYLPIGFSLAAFDFIGCGTNQEADTVSLGYRESQQVQTITNYLKSKNYSIILWGRSMGAVSALMCGKAEVIVADSAFKSLKSLCKQVVKANSPKFIPNCLISCLFPCVFYKLRKDVQQKGNYDMEDIDIKESVKKIDKSTTLIFITGDEDLLVHHRNSQKLFNSFEGPRKHIQIFKGNHNSKRPQSVYLKIMNLVCQEFYHNKYLPKTQ